MNGVAPDFGALVISLDFELIWGVRDRLPPDGGWYRPNLTGARAAIPRILDLFEAFGIAATWATVGCLFAHSRTELNQFRPATLPRYRDPRLLGYDDPLGDSEADDPLHYAPSLIEAIRRRPRQEIGSHTFGHYYCLEPGHDRASFRADLASAVAIARERGIHLQALVFPRNQFNPAYARDIVDAGFRVCRINAAGWLYREGADDRYFRPDVRAARLLDAYLGLAGSQVIAWDAIPFINGLCCLPESRFLRPFKPRLRALEPLRLERITGEIQKAARDRGVFHLWWHPHNFGRYTEENLALLRHILQAFQRCQETWGMRSLTMTDAATVAASIQAALPEGTARCA